MPLVVEDCRTRTGLADIIPVCRYPDFMLDRIRFHALCPLAKHQNIFRHPGAGESRVLAELLEQEALRLGSLHLNHRIFPDYELGVILPACRFVSTDYVAAEVVESAAPVASLVADEIH